jgi:hypothetical protein
LLLAFWRRIIARCDITALGAIIARMTTIAFQLAVSAWSA